MNSGSDNEDSRITQARAGVGVGMMQTRPSPRSLARHLPLHGIVRRTDPSA